MSARRSKAGLKRKEPYFEPGPGAPRIHGGGRRLDAVLDFVNFTIRSRPLTSFLDEAPRRIARIVGADVASLYLLEGEGDELVMRGNVGFPDRALGQVRLSVGEGITGAAIECMRPISVAVAQQHLGYRHFPELGEEEFPVFAAVPVLGRSGPLGVLTVQRRRSAPWNDRDIELLVALSASIAAAIRHAELLDSVRERNPRRTAAGTRKVTLPGRPVVKGRALGVLAALRRPPARSKGTAGTDEDRRLSGAFEIAERALRVFVARSSARGLGREGAFLNVYLQIIADARLRGRASELIAAGAGIAHALGQVAREATRVATRFSRDAFMQDRARDIEDLCDAVVMLASTDPAAKLPSKAVLMGDQLTVFDLLVSARAQPSALALTERAFGPRTHVLLQLLNVPALVDVGGLFRWATEGDIALLDADHGLLVINPSRAEISMVRREREPRDKRARGAEVDRAVD
ncbi:MAG TPA: GAF domain-containing protein [Polyangiaceae bacterium]|nr:GAF domain-containing protein [Polyangiaceae bacterium]